MIAEEALMERKKRGYRGIQSEEFEQCEERKRNCMYLSIYRSVAPHRTSLSSLPHSPPDLSCREPEQQRRVGRSAFTGGGNIFRWKYIKF